MRLAAAILLLVGCSQEVEVRKGLYADTTIYRYEGKVDTVITLTEYAFYKALVEVDSIIGGMQENIDSLMLRIVKIDSNHVTLKCSWSANKEADIAGYQIYWGTESLKYDRNIDVGNITEYMIWYLDARKDWHFAVTAYDTAGNESGYSKEAIWNAR